MDISQSELMAHPLMKQVTADIAETRAKQQADRMVAEMEAARIRGEQGRYIQGQFNQAIQDYERLRKETHEALGRAWNAVQAYARLTGSPPSNFHEAVFNRINLPTLIPSTSPWATVITGTTTQGAVMGWMSTQGKTWGWG